MNGGASDQVTRGKKCLMNLDHVMKPTRGKKCISPFMNPEHVIIPTRGASPFMSLDHVIKPNRGKKCISSFMNGEASDQSYPSVVPLSFHEP